MTNQERALEISATLGDAEKAAGNMPECAEKLALLKALEKHHATLLEHAQSLETELGIDVSQLTVGGSK